MSRDDSPKCVLCVHFFVTWERFAPRGCRAFDIKSPMYPSVIVERESNQPCQAYERKFAGTALDRASARDS